MEQRRHHHHGVVSHYSLSRPEIEDRSSDRDDGDRVFGQSKQSWRLSEFNANLPRGNPTSSKFEWKKLLPRHGHEELGGGRFSNPSQVGITVPILQVTMEPGRGRISGGSRDSGNVITDGPDGNGRFSNPSQVGSTLPNLQVIMEPERGRLSCGPRDSGNVSSDGNGKFSNPSQVGITLPSMPVTMEPEKGRLSGGPRDSGNVITEGNGRFSTSSQFGTTLPQIPLSVEPGIGSFSGPCNLDVGVPQYSVDMYGYSNALPSRTLIRDSLMVKDFLIQKTQNQAQLDSLEVYYEAASVYTKLGSQLKEFEMALQKDAIRGSFDKGLQIPTYASGLGLDYVDESSIESHVDSPLSIRSSDMKSNPLVGAHSMRSCDRRISPLEDFSSDEGKCVNYTCPEDQKIARGFICKMYEKFYGNMAGLEEEHAGSGLVRASISDQTPDRVDECSPKVHLKSPRLGDHVSPLKKQWNALYVPASESMHPKVKESDVRSHASALLKDQDAYKKHGHLLLTNEHGLEREWSEMLPVTCRDACLDGAEGGFEQWSERERSEILPVSKSDSLGNLLKRKDGNEDSQQIVVKKARLSNVAKSSNEADCQMTVNSDNHVSQLVKSRDRDSGDINKCLETSPQKIISIKSSPVKQSPSVEKSLIPSPQKEDATHSFVKSPLFDDPDGGNDLDGAHGQGDSLEDNSSLAKIELPHITPSQVKNQMPGKFTKRSQDDRNGGHNQVVDFSKDSKGSQNALDGTPCQQGNVIKGYTRVKIEPSHVPPRPVKKKKVGKFTKRIQDGLDGTCSQEGNSKERNITPAQTEPPNKLGPRLGKKKDGKKTKRFGDAPVSSNEKATPVKRETFHAHSTMVNNQEPGKLNRVDPNGAHLLKGDSLDGNVILAPLENSKDFKQRVQCAFLKFVKQLNESAELRNFLEQGKAGELKCKVCGRKSEEFVDMKSLVRHTLTSPTVDRRALHLGFHKALCLMMGWKSALSFDNSWICETLPDSEASALKEDLIIWPPVVIIHNSSVQNSNPDERVTLTTEMVEAYLKDMGFGEKTKLSWGSPGDQSVILVKFSGTLSGFQEAERLHSFYIEKKHGKIECQHFAYSKNCITMDSTSNAPADKLENVIYGYIGIAEDLDKLDTETKKRCFVKSKMEIQNIITAF